MRMSEKTNSLPPWRMNYAIHLHLCAMGSTSFVEAQTARKPETSGT